ncbi:MAG TPA: hypothetical protein DEB63_17980 [Agrobacterium sp.]|nr:hypothetical protein [Agrobacterium sp.]
MKELRHVSKGSLIYPACRKLRAPLSRGPRLSRAKNDATARRHSIRARFHEKQTANLNLTVVFLGLDPRIHRSGLWILGSILKMT